MKIGGNKKDCTGCGACAAVCKHISLSMDDEGFRYPEVNHLDCGNCGRCQDVCPMVDNTLNKRRPFYVGLNQLQLIGEGGSPQVFAAWNKDQLIRFASSSGGIFTLFAKQIIDAGGIVFGAAFVDGMRLRHILVDSVKGLELLRGSKYIQSEIGDAFNRVKSALKEGKQVLFSGTPCQVAGLKSFLKDDTKLLITCDFVCHGVPSEKLFRKYVKEQEKEYNSEVKEIIFRSKISGWKRYSVQLKFANGQTYEKPYDQDNFMRLFLADLCLRPSCYICPFATIPRQGDITLADYWGVETAHSDIDDDKGISLLFINTAKADDLLLQVAKDIKLYPSKIELAVRENSCAVRPTKYRRERERFFKNIDSLELMQLCKIHIKQQSWLWTKNYYITKAIRYYCSKLMYLRCKW